MPPAHLVTIQALEEGTATVRGRARLARRLPDAVMDAVDGDGCFRLLVPADDVEDALMRVWYAVEEERAESLVVIDAVG